MFRAQLTEFDGGKWVGLVRDKAVWRLYSPGGKRAYKDSSERQLPSIAVAEPLHLGLT